MKRRDFIFSALGTILMGVSPAFGQASQDQIVRQLREQGYTRIRINRTLLGRVRILATSPGQRREIVINPATGAILRDYFSVETPQRSDQSPRVIDPDGDGFRDGGGGSGGGSGGSGSGGGSGGGAGGRGSGGGGSDDDDGDDDDGDDDDDDDGDDDDD